MAIAFCIACSVYSSKGYSCIITAGLEGKHKRYSLHYKGFALDLRTKHCWPGEDNRESKLNQLQVDLQMSLGEQFQVFVENLSTINEHIHIEFDPKYI
jgi:hypothetical protein